MHTRRRRINLLQPVITFSTLLQNAKAENILQTGVV